MSKRYRNKDQCIHVWAQNPGTDGESGNVSFNGPVLWSYSYPIAIILPDGENVLVDDGACVHNGRGSPTTSNHIGIARYACRHLEVSIVPMLRQIRRPLQWLHRKASGKYEIDESNRSKADVREWSAAHILNRPDAVRKILALFGMSRSFDAIKRKIEADAIRAEKADARRADRSMRKEVGAALKFTRAHIVERCETAIDRAFDSFKPYANSAAMAHGSAASTLQGYDRQILGYLKYANANGYGKRSTDRLREFRRILKAKQSDLAERLRRMEEKARRASIGRYIKAFRILHRAYYAGGAFNPADDCAIFKHNSDISDYHADDPDTNTRELVILYGFAVTSYLSQRDRIPAATRAKLNQWCTDHSELMIATGRERDIRRASRMEARRTETEKRLAREREEKIAAWLRGENVYGLPYTSDEHGGALVRAKSVRRDGDGTIIDGTVQTSQGASVPLVDAIKAYRAAAACRRAGREWKRNGDRIRVGHFQVDRIDADGSFTAGCHRLSWPTMDALAADLGIQVSTA